ncbi:hypothetical protein [Parasutterella sp.]|uniref:hypothetical protein n=1 Tax=Parasutterella sp. TaxID=2049037 RepID=UPI0039965773
MTKKPDDSLLPVTAGDINKLKSMVDDLYNNVGKTLVHAEVNNDDIEKHCFKHFVRHQMSLG